MNKNIFAVVAFAQIASLSLLVSPAEVIQGEPFFVRINGAANIASVKSVTFDGAAAGIFMYQGKPAVLLGIDLNKKPGSYELITKLSDGQVQKKTVDVGARKKIVAPLGIPEKLGGNTPASQKALVNALAEENASLANIRTGTKAFWTEKFLMPLKEIIVTDPYGYSRQTGEYSIAHKGADFRAKESTPIMAINRGVVRVAKTYREYGKTIVVDHGLGLMSFYMHLSKIKVNVGELVGRGQVIGLAGQTGYAESPHLHLTVRINGFSIDPIKFFGLFQF
ncbi:MAG: M23 family metallopeptidase [bacterium]|nr:M23 family metallopeptidase [bacterium]